MRPDFFRIDQRKMFIFCLAVVILLLVFFSYFTVNNGLTSNVIKDLDDDTLLNPEIKTGGEVNVGGFKFSNIGNIILSSPEEIHCSWKPSRIDDGYKICEAIFEVSNSAEVKRELQNPLVNLYFEDGSSVRNLEISYSQTFEIVEETFEQGYFETLPAPPIPSAEESLSEFGAASVKEFNRGSLRNRDSGRQSNSAGADEVIYLSDETKFKRKDYYNFVYLDLDDSETNLITGFSVALDSGASDPEGDLLDEAIDKTFEESLDRIIEEKIDEKIDEKLGDILDKKIEEKLDEKINQEIEIIIAEETLDVEGDFTGEIINDSLDLVDINVTINDSQGIVNQSSRDDQGETVNDTLEDSLDDLPEVINESENKTLETFSWKSKKPDKFEISLDDVNIDTSFSFAIKVSFEIPNTQENAFDLEIIEEDFHAAIDPGVSGCAGLNFEDGVYLLNSSVSSSDTCFIFGANNVTLDCQGNTINFGASAGSSYGVYSEYNETKILNCNFSKTNTSNLYSPAIYLKDSQNSILQSNNITIFGNYGMGIFLRNVDNSLISLNRIMPNGISCLGISLSDGSYNNFSNNFINTAGHQSSGIYLNSSLNNNVINNDIETLNNDASGVHLFDSPFSNVSSNDVFTSSSDAYGINIISSSNSNIAHNNLVTEADFAHGINLNSVDVIILNNTITTSGEDAYGFNILSNDSEIISNDITTNADYAYGLFINEDVVGTLLDRLDVITHGADAYALFADSDVSDLDIRDGTFSTTGDYGYGLLMHDVYSIDLFNITVSSLGPYSSAFFFEYGGNDINISKCTSSTVGTGSYPVEIYFGVFNLSVEDSFLSKNGSNDLFSIYGLDDSIFGPFTGGFWNFTNTTLTGVSWQTQGEGLLNYYNYLDLTVKSGNSPLLNAAINVRNHRAVEAFSLLTGSSGILRKLRLPYYSQNGSGAANKTYYNYTLTTTKANYHALSRTFNMSESRSLLMLLNAISDSGGNSGGGGGTATCKAKWDCDSWGGCVDGKQGRDCEKITPECSGSRPDISRSCKITKVKISKKSRNTLFDIGLEILDESIEETLMAKVSLINFGIPGRVLGNITYRAFDSTGSMVYEEKEIVPVETQLEFIKKIDLSFLGNGEYTLFVDLKYNGQKEPANAQAKFRIGGGGFFSLSAGWFKIILFVLLGLLVVAGIVFVIFYLNKVLKRRKEKRLHGNLPLGLKPSMYHQKSIIPAAEKL
ncbi:right-handed parallel beta-helix repeat-containing protein [Candidatus Pacearchaeota archaeon]|nr:right-handed parallel beta-helix repeat-containing protein [Candidatus Pacearchaeota archaeon]